MSLICCLTSANSGESASLVFFTGLVLFIKWSSSFVNLSSALSNAMPSFAVLNTIFFKSLTLLRNCLTSLDGFCLAFVFLVISLAISPRSVNNLPCFLSSVTLLVASLLARFCLFGSFSFIAL